MLRTFLICSLLLGGLLCAAEKPEQKVSGFQTYEVKRNAVPAVALAESAPRHVILMIGDGMGTEQVSAAWVCNKGKLNIMRLPVTGLSRTLSASHLVTDSAAGGTALACGRRTTNKWLGLSPERERLVSLADTARELGMGTGLVVTKAITDATPAAFYAHVDNREKTAEIAADLAKTPFTVVAGGGADHFSAEQVGRMQAAGTQLTLAAPKHCPAAPGRGDFLPARTAEALSVLEKEPEGFFLMIEGSQIDTAGHDNKLEAVVEETLDFDRTLGVVLDWMETHPDTLLVVTADHQTGGLVILGGSVEKGELKAVFTTGSHNGMIVPVYAAGVGAGVFCGVQDNADVACKIRAIMSRGR